jgi:molybdenum cofactor cytidylyltransferase
VSVAGIVLAAGGSRRLGQAKQLVPFHGEELVRTAVRAARGSQCARVAVVLGARVRDVMPAVLGTGAEVVHNPKWETGIASSIAAGVAWAQTGKHDAVLLCVCDQPLISAAHLDALIREHEATGDVVASRYGAVVGVPAVFPEGKFAALCALTGDQGARALLRHGIVREVPWDGGAVDVDTPADLEALRAM